MAVYKASLAGHPKLVDLVVKEAETAQGARASRIVDVVQRYGMKDSSLPILNAITSQKGSSWWSKAASQVAKALDPGHLGIG